MTASLTRRLTPREREVVELIGKHHTRKQVRLALGLEETMVRKHLTSIAKKAGIDRTLNIESQIAAVAEHLLTADLTLATCEAPGSVGGNPRRVA